jgi:ureidoacrylate peracid hydrolase
MATIAYEKPITALLVVDPYNDFISEGGKIWNRIRSVAEANDCVPATGPERGAQREASRLLRDASSISSGRLRNLEVHCTYPEAAWTRKTFEYGTWGGEIRPEFEPKPGEMVTTEHHWCSRGYSISHW